ncbi:MAG: hypothetical protein M3Y53_00495 [Thermoproteota archaeon]|nr:hypothetical protein [Thermoproteota archaeon]
MIVPKTHARQKVNNSNRIYLRLPSSYLSFFQAMAEDYYQRGKIEAPSIGLLAKTCLITAGNAWNRMCIQLMNKEYERKMRQEVEQERHQQQQQQQNYQQRQGFVHTPEDLTPSFASKRPPPVVEETKRHAI